MSSGPMECHQCKMTPPNSIYLQIGEDCPEDARWEDLREVTFCEEPVFRNDLKYISEQLLRKWIEETCINPEEMLKKMEEL